MKGTTSTCNCYVRPFNFQGHVGRGGGNTDLPENSGLDHAGRTTVWWNGFAKGIVVEEEWKENFRMSRVNLLKLCNDLCVFSAYACPRARIRYDIAYMVLRVNGLK